MANEILKVDDEELIRQAKKMQDAVNDYKKFGKKPFDDDIDALKAMNTDFTAKLVTMVGNLNSGNKKIIKALEGIAKNTQKIADNLKEVDEHAVNSMGYVREG